MQWQIKIYTVYIYYCLVQHSHLITKNRNASPPNTQRCISKHIHKGIWCFLKVKTKNTLPGCQAPIGLFVVSFPQIKSTEMGSLVSLSQTTSTVTQSCWDLLPAWIYGCSITRALHRCSLKKEWEHKPSFDHRKLQGCCKAKCWVLYFKLWLSSYQYKKELSTSA